MAIDPKKLSKPELKNLLENARRLGREDIATEVLLELTLRGGARSSDFAVLTWNQDTAKAALGPFIEVSKSVPNSQRTTYTEAGGRRIGRSKDDPEWMWVDCYTAMKTPELNAVFVCYIPRPGDDAWFEIHLDGATAHRFEAQDLSQALDVWRGLAAAAADRAGPV